MVLMYGVLTVRGTPTPDARSRSVTSLKNCAVRSAPCCFKATSSRDSSDASTLSESPSLSNGCAALRLGGKFFSFFCAFTLSGSNAVMSVLGAIRSARIKQSGSAETNKI